VDESLPQATHGQDRRRSCETVYSPETSAASPNWDGFQRLHVGEGGCKNTLRQVARLLARTKMVNLVQTNQETSTLSRSWHLAACGITFAGDVEIWRPSRRRKFSLAWSRLRPRCSPVSLWSPLFFFSLKYFQPWFCTIRDLRRLKICRGSLFSQQFQCAREFNPDPHTLHHSSSFAKHEFAAYL